MNDAKKYNKPIEELRWELIAHRKESAKIRRTGENARCGCVGWNSSFKGCAVYQSISNARAALIALSKAILEDAKPKMYSGENPPWKIETTTTEPKVGAATIRSGGGSTLPWGPESTFFPHSFETVVPKKEPFPSTDDFTRASWEERFHLLEKLTGIHVSFDIGGHVNGIQGKPRVRPWFGDGVSLDAPPESFAKGTTARVGLRRPEPAPKIDLKGTKIWWNPPIADPMAPTVSELMKGVPLSALDPWPERPKETAPAEYIGLSDDEKIYANRLRRIDTAIRKGMRVRITYKDADGAITERDIVPMAVRVKNDDFPRWTTNNGQVTYIDAYCVLRDRKRVFRLDRVKSLELVVY